MAKTTKPKRGRTKKTIAKGPKRAKKPKKARR